MMGAIARIPGSMAGTSEPVAINAPDATPGKVMSTLNFYETPEGTMAIEGLHVGEFNPEIQQHRILQIIMDFLPQILDPVNMPDQTHTVSEAHQ